MDRAALTALPSALRTELADALVSLDAERIGESVHRVSEQNPVLGALLASRVDQLEYTAILRAVRTDKLKELA